MSFVFLLIAIGSNVGAQVLFKYAALRGLHWGFQFPDLITKNFPLILAAFLLAFSAPFYFLALRQFSLSVAYPVSVAVTFLIVNLFAVNYFGEKLNTLQMVGYTLVVSGIFFIAYFTNSSR
ncbi:MAG TPA: SMR family transporter [Candidatus Paceibacterota bacterium]